MKTVDVLMMSMKMRISMEIDSSSVTQIKCLKKVYDENNEDAFNATEEDFAQYRAALEKLQAHIAAFKWD